MVVLAAFVRREGIWLAAGVMRALDVVANWIGTGRRCRRIPPGSAPGGLLPITPFGAFVLVTTLPLLGVMKD